MTDQCEICRKQDEAVKKKAHQLQLLEMNLVEQNRPLYEVQARCGTSRRKYLALQRQLGREGLEWADAQEDTNQTRIPRRSPHSGI